MPNAERTVTIAAPVEKVFDFFTTPANEKSWRSNVVDIQPSGEPAVGGIVKMKVAGPLGIEIKTDIEITAYRPHQFYGFRAVNGPVRPEGSYTFTVNGSGTDVTFALAVELSGVKGKMLAGQVQKSMDGEMAALDKAKALLEA